MLRLGRAKVVIKIEWSKARWDEEKSAPNQ